MFNFFNRGPEKGKTVEKKEVEKPIERKEGEEKALKSFDKYLNAFYNSMDGKFKSALRPLRKYALPLLMTLPTISSSQGLRHENYVGDKNKIEVKDLKEKGDKITKSFDLEGYYRNKKKNKDGGTSFNPGVFISPGGLEFEFNKKTEGNRDFFAEYPYAEGFKVEEGSQINKEEVTKKIEDQFKKVIKNKLIRILETKGVYRAKHEGEDNLLENKYSGLKIKDVEIVGVSSPEAEKYGSGSVVAGNKEKENLLTAERRAELTKEVLLGLGIDPNVIKIKCEEVQFSDTEWKQLNDLAEKKGIVGLKEQDKIAELIIRYNDGEYDNDGEVKSILKNILDAKRGAFINITFEGNKKTQILLPIPVIFLLLLSKKVRRFPGDLVRRFNAWKEKRRKRKMEKEGLDNKKEPTEGGDKVLEQGDKKEGDKKQGGDKVPSDGKKEGDKKQGDGKVPQPIKEADGGNKEGEKVPQPIKQPEGGNKEEDSDYFDYEKIKRTGEIFSEKDIDADRLKEKDFNFYEIYRKAEEKIEEYDKFLMNGHFLEEELYKKIDDEEYIKKGLDYRAFIEGVSEILEEKRYKTEEELKVQIAYDLLSVWEEYDRNLRSELGIEIDENTTLDYRHDEKKVLWAKIGAVHILNLAKKNNSPEEANKELVKLIEEFYAEKDGYRRELLKRIQDEYVFGTNNVSTTNNNYEYKYEGENDKDNTEQGNTVEDYEKLIEDSINEQTNKKEDNKNLEQKEQTLEMDPFEYNNLKDDLVLINKSEKDSVGIITLKKFDFKSEFGRKRYEELREIPKDKERPFTFNKGELRLIGDEMEKIILKYHKVKLGEEEEKAYLEERAIWREFEDFVEQNPDEDIPEELEYRYRIAEDRLKKIRESGNKDFEEIKDEG